MDSSSLLAIAVAAAEAGAAAALELFNVAHLQQWEKADGSIITRADLASETAILGVLERLAPGEACISEEAGGAAADLASWIVDPIDGTENFSRGHPVWATLVARAVAGDVLIGVAIAPALRRRWWAVRGGGAFGSSERGVTRLSVSECSDRRLGTFDHGGLHDCPTNRDREVLVGVAAGFRCAWGWGNFWGHTRVAEGAAEAALSYGARIWDIAVPALLVSEAGGHWSDIQGLQCLTNGTLLSSNGRFHAELVHELHPV